MAELPLAPLDRLLRKAGAPRVSESAAEALAEIFEQLGLKIGSQAMKLAKHAGRKTLTAEDIKLASNTLRFGEF